MAHVAETYYPSNIAFQVLKNKIYKLSWDQHGRPHVKLLTKGSALTTANDPNINKNLRDALVAAFERGDIA